jgi:hypothetical protein
VKTKAGSTWKVLGVVGGVALFALALLGGLVAAGWNWGWPDSLSREDREVLMVAAELTLFLPDFVLRSDAERFSKRQFFDGRTELAYEYLHPDPAAPLRLASRVMIAPNRAAARTLHQAHAESFDALAAESGYSLEFRDRFFTWGDASRYGVLMDGDDAAGYVLACRRGEKVIAVELTGVALEEGLFGELVLPSLQSLESYQP